MTFTGLASTAESPRTRVGDDYHRAVPWWRPPFMASFAAGAFDFILVAAHVRWGAHPAARVAELRAMLDWIVARSNERYFGDKDVLALGDFNIGAPIARELQTIGARGLVVPPGLGAEVRTDLAQHKR